MSLSRGAPAPPSRAIGLPWAGGLLHGRRLPVRGPGYETWDPIRKRAPNRAWRRWGTSRLVRVVRRVLAAHGRRHRGAPPVLVGDLSRPRGGDFGPRYGGIGHASHQNGLDVDVYYPRNDGRLDIARRPEQVDRVAAQQLVDAFVRAGAQKVFVGPSLALRGPPRVVQPLVNHDNHLHVRAARPYGKVSFPSCHTESVISAVKPARLFSRRASSVSARSPSSGANSSA